MNRGFSLVEVAVASALATAMSLGMVLVMRAGERVTQVEGDQMSISSELRRGMNSMASNLLSTRSNQLLRPAGGGAWVAWADNPPDLATYAGLRFRMPQDLDLNGTVLDAAGIVEWSINTFTFELGGVNGQELLRVERDPGGAVVVNAINPLDNPRRLAYGVTALTFRRWPGATSVIEISMTVQRGAVVPGAPTSGEAQPDSLTTRVRMRVP